MSDIIHLLPDSIANQIAAGEVIQRPASVVKELMENAIDAGAKNIQLIIKDAGKSLIQVIDDGKGMSEIDARMCFERHATSKIKSAADLFALHTMGFRGEAMASIAAIAHVELKTALADSKFATTVVIEGSKVISQEPSAPQAGTNIAVRNLFYNVPARRNFLKSTAVETKHIIDEFIHIALAHASIFFSMHHNGSEVFHLKAGNLRQRIVGIFGKNYNEKLVPVEEQTDYITIKGFIGKPELTKKTRGEQYFFVNNRFIKSNFLNHAIVKTYEGLIAEKSYPFYCLFIEVDPATIDVNVHPTKQEIKFEDEKAIYLILHAAAKHGLSQYSVMPTLDFEHQSNFNRIINDNAYTQQPFKVAQSNLNKESFAKNMDSEYKSSQHVGNENWEKLYAFDEEEQERVTTIQSKMSLDESDSFVENKTPLIQLHQQYILSPIKSGFILIDQQRAHQRILFEKYIQQFANQKNASQQTLFPKTINLNAGDAYILEDILEDLQVLGFDIQLFGKNSFVIHGMPMDLINEDETKIIENLLEEYKQSEKSESFDKRKQLAKAMAYQTSIKQGVVLKESQMQQLVDELFACEQPTINPSGKPTLMNYNIEDIHQKFNR
ncbi:MAG: DNA mismatch repair endonuclease MutL [Chitinophagales bacterium]|nr:DNA mismatch repair endonuclease MutL [Chitinophagales bacterium]